MSNELHVFNNDHDWVIATSPKDAIAVWCAEMGENIENYSYEEETWDVLDDGKFISIFVEEDDTEATRKTCAEWIAEKGRGFLCTTDR